MKFPAPFFPLAILAAGLSANPVVSNVRGRVLSAVKTGSFHVWTIEALFDLQNDSSGTCRIFPGLRILEPDRVLQDEGPYLNYSDVSGDTAVTSGTDFRVVFTVKDTAGFDSVRVKITAWDRRSWPPWPNRTFFERHHGLCLDIRNAPVHQNSMNFLNFLKTNSSPVANNFGFGAQTLGVFRVMGDHPKQRLVTCTPYCWYPDTVYPVPFPSVSLGDPSDGSSMAGCAGDCHLAIVDVENWLSYEFFRAMKLPTGPQDWQGSPAYYDLKWEQYNYKFTRTTPFGPTTIYRYRAVDNGANVSGMSFSTWTLKPEEMLDGEIQHALGFAFWIEANYCVYPATKSDVDATPNAPPLGLRLRLKPTYDMNNPKIIAMGRDSTNCRILLRCLQKYGAVSAQTAGADQTVHFMTSNLPGFPFNLTVSTKFNYLLMNLGLDLVGDFDVVDWNWQVAQYEGYPAQ